MLLHVSEMPIADRDIYRDVMIRDRHRLIPNAAELVVLKSFIVKHKVKMPYLFLGFLFLTS
jgi:hypothetical protein